MKLIIDRFEGDFAICEMENRQMVSIPLVVLQDAVEGNEIEIKVNKGEHNRKRIELIMDSVWED